METMSHPRDTHVVQVAVSSRSLTGLAKDSVLGALRRLDADDSLRGSWKAEVEHLVRVKKAELLELERIVAAADAVAPSAMAFAVVSSEEPEPAKKKSKKKSKKKG